jgi:hypothetical protein
MPMVRQHARRAAANWRTDPQAAVDIEAHLTRSGFDQIDVNAQVIAHENHVSCSTNSCSLPKVAGSHCCVSSASEENLPGALVPL